MNGGLFYKGSSFKFTLTAIEFQCWFRQTWVNFLSTSVKHKTVNSLFKVDFRHNTLVNGGLFYKGSSFKFTLTAIEFQCWFRQTWVNFLSTSVKHKTVNSLFKVDFRHNTLVNGGLFYKGSSFKFTLTAIEFQCWFRQTWVNFLSTSVKHKTVNSLFKVDFRHNTLVNGGLFYKGSSFKFTLTAIEFQCWFRQTWVNFLSTSVKHKTVNSLFKVDFLHNTLVNGGLFYKGS